MTINYDYDPNAAAKADDVAMRIDTSGAFIGQFKSAFAIVSKTGTHGIHFEFASPGGGSANFDVYTKKEDGTPTFGNNQLQAMQAILGLRGLRSFVGETEVWDEGKRVKVEGDTFPDLCNKDIGLVLQKEKYTKGDNSEGFRMNLQGIFHPVSRLTASELKEGKVKPEKLEKILRSLKDKDSRTSKAAEPAQAAVGAAAGAEGAY